MTLNDRLEAYFRERQGRWIDGRELATVAGSYGWRTRVSDLRKRGLEIVNRQRKVDGYIVSEYQMLPPPVRVTVRIEDDGQQAFL